MQPNEDTGKTEAEITEDIDVDDVEGHRRAAGRIAEGDDDVEGHRRAAGRIADDDDDVEGHRFKKA
jgi:hypothetical protein